MARCNCSSECKGGARPCSAGRTSGILHGWTMVHGGLYTCNKGSEHARLLLEQTPLINCVSVHWQHASIGRSERACRNWIFLESVNSFALLSS